MTQRKPTRNRFDDLPEELVMRIFCFLPTQTAVKASLVCKSWKDLWMSLPNLSFKDHALDARGWRRDLFLKFASRVISLRKPCKIDEFSLDCNVYHNMDLVWSWIDYAMDHSVEVIKLRIYPSLPGTMLLNCKSLKEVHPHASNHFPNLKILRLFWFHSDEWTRLLSSCPLLEELHLSECSFRYAKHDVHISAPKLTILSITGPCIFCNFDHRCQVFIHGTNLKRFNYEGKFTSEYRFITSPSLQEACIRIPHIYDPEKWQVGRADRLLEELYNVNCLSISCQALKLLDEEKDQIFTKLPVFENLTRLRFTHGCVYISSDGLLSLLSKSPSLHHLEFMEGLQIVHTDITEVTGLQPTPHCFLTTLQNITIGKFYGRSGEFCGLNVMLMLPTVLEKLDIKFMGNKKGKREVLRKLSEMFPEKMLQCISVS